MLHATKLHHSRRQATAAGSLVLMGSLGVMAGSLSCDLLAGGGVGPNTLMLGKGHLGLGPALWVGQPGISLAEGSSRRPLGAGLVQALLR